MSNPINLTKRASHHSPNSASPIHFPSLIDFASDVPYMQKCVEFLNLIMFGFASSALWYKVDALMIQHPLHKQNRMHCCPLNSYNTYSFRVILSPRISCKMV